MDGRRSSELSVRTALAALVRVSRLYQGARTSANAELVAEALVASEGLLGSAPSNDDLVASIEAAGLAGGLPLSTDYLRGWRVPRKGNATHRPGTSGNGFCSKGSQEHFAGPRSQQQYHNFGRRYASQSGERRDPAKFQCDARVADRDIPQLPGLSVPAREVAGLQDTVAPGLYWAGDLEAFVLQLEGNVRFVGNVCKIGRPCRHRVCNDAACGRELVGCGGYHHPRVHGPSRDVRGLDLPHGRATPRWLSSREEIPGVLARKDAGDDLEAIAMHAVLVAALHKKYNRGLPAGLA